MDEFSNHIDTFFGLEVLRNLFKTETEIAQIKACLAAVHLIRSPDNWMRVLLCFHPIRRLLDKIRDTLMDPREHCHFQPSILRQILVAFGSLVSNEILARLSKKFKLKRQQCLTNDSCVLWEARKALRSDSRKLIKFTCGDQEEYVPQQSLCQGSEYFRGMFRNAFSERTRNTFEFNEEKEQCSFEVFCRFLHFICGCGRDCFIVQETDVPALLKVTFASFILYCASMFAAPVQSG
ncbi:unnamed protein product [Gongylonema pulchrum]|uniref:CNOT1_CAF1_bind domain-containing protein n=1 Tax=Gongylonema pulchrum TaxID=637853 RepID=A0A183ESD0_9BILA|nr:unnamed protein product [Gongylonema pulchrum]